MCSLAVNRHWQVALVCARCVGLAGSTSIETGASGGMAETEMKCRYLGDDRHRCFCSKFASMPLSQGSVLIACLAQISVTVKTEVWLSLWHTLHTAQETETEILCHDARVSGPRDEKTVAFRHALDPTLSLLPFDADNHILQIREQTLAPKTAHSYGAS